MTKIAEKIAKIVAKADSSTHKEEAEAFMEKAQALMMAHGLSLLDLGRLDADDPVGTDHDVVGCSKSDPWERKLIFKLAKYYGADAVSHTFSYKNRIMFSLVGRESARVTASLMIPFVIRQTRKVARQAHRDGYYRTQSEALRKVGYALVIRVQDIITARQESEPKGTGMNALVPLDMIELEKKEQFGELNYEKPRTLEIDGTAIRAAGGISLNQQTTASAGTKKIGKK